MLSLKSLPRQLYNRRWNPIHMPKPCMITLTTAFVKILWKRDTLLNISGSSCPQKSYIHHIPPIQALTHPCILKDYMTIWTYLKLTTPEFWKGIVLIGLRRCNQLLKYLLILRRQAMLLPHTLANSAPLVGILSLRIRFLLVAAAPYRELCWIRLQWECSLTWVPAKVLCPSLFIWSIPVFIPSQNFLLLVKV